MIDTLAAWTLDEFRLWRVDLLYGEPSICHDQVIGFTRYKKPDFLVIFWSCLWQKMMASICMMPTRNYIVLYFLYNHSMWWPAVLNNEAALWNFWYNLWYISGVGSLPGLFEGVDVSLVLIARRLEDVE